MTATFRDRTTRQRKPKGAASEPVLQERTPEQAERVEIIRASLYGRLEAEQKRRQRILKGALGVIFILALIALVAVGRAVT